MEEFMVAPVKPPVRTDVLNSLDIRVGTIERVEDIEKSDKLVRLVVDFGDRKRNVLVGMRKERKDPKEVEGRQALFVVNIEPRKMMGHLSEAMLFDIGFQDGIIPVLAVPERTVPNGVRVG
jgi:methionine--tRNA ligase beta chain